MRDMIHELSDTDLETYSRQVVLADIGYEGQLRLRNAKVCLVGVGGLGCPTALKLAGMGVGYLRLVDRDIVSRSDLHRQYLYDSQSVGQPKVEAAYHRLRRLNPDVSIDPIPASLNAENAAGLFAGMDLVLDGLDRPEPRYIVNRSCHSLNIPYIFGAAIESFGNVATLIPGRTFCLECFMPDLKDEDLPSCGVVGVHPAVLGIISAVQVSEAVRLVTGREPKLLNKLMFIDLREFAFEILNIDPLPSCPVCGSQPTRAATPVRERLIEETCARDGRRNFVISPKTQLNIDLDQLQAVLQRKGMVITHAGLFGIAFQHSPDITVSLLKSGTMTVQTTPIGANINQSTVWDLYRSLLIDDLHMPAQNLPETPKDLQLESACRSDH